MALIEIPLNTYTYRFRRLAREEESRLKFPKGVDQRRTVLAHAFANISGLEVSPDDAEKIISNIPEADRSDPDLYEVGSGSFVLRSEKENA